MGSQGTRRGSKYREDKGLDISKLEVFPNRDERGWPSGGKQTGVKFSSASCSLEVTSAVNTSCLYLDISQDLSYLVATLYLPVIWLFPISGVIQFKMLCLKI